MRVAMFSFNHPNYDWLDQLTRPSKVAYCQRWGWDFIHDTWQEGGDERHQMQHIGWHKITMMRRILETYDAALYVECDALVVNQDLNPMREITTMDGEKLPFLEIPHLGLTTDFNGCNAGVVFGKRTDVTHQFLDTMDNVGWWLFKDHGYREQRGMEHFGNVHPYKNYVTWLPQRTMNSYIFHPGTPPHRPGRYQIGDWIVHLAGTGNDDRRRFIECLLRGQNPGG